MTERRRLADRRESKNADFKVDGQVYTATVGVEGSSGTILEVFLGGAKEGSHMAAVLGDAAVVISVALQHGVPVAAMAKSVARLRTRQPTPEELDAGAPVPSVPATVIGAALDLIEDLQAQTDSEVIMTEDEAIARINELDREIDQAPGWGAGVAAKVEERDGLARQLGLPVRRLVGDRPVAD